MVPTTAHIIRAVIHIIQADLLIALHAAIRRGLLLITQEVTITIIIIISMVTAMMVTSIIPAEEETAVVPEL